MNCPECKAVMTSKTAFTSPMTVTHTCPNCGHSKVVTFGGNANNPKHVPNAVGHILTVAHWNQALGREEFFKYQIIGISKDRFGRLTYLIPVWHEERNFFAGYSEESTFIRSISKEAFMMSEAHKEAAAFIRYNRIANYCKTLYSRYAWMNLPVQVVNVYPATHGERAIVETAYELEAPLNLAQIAKRKMAYYSQLAQVALSASGLRNEAVQA